MFTRITVHLPKRLLRIYFDENEVPIKFEFQCIKCTQWPAWCRCTRPQIMAEYLESIFTGLDNLRNRVRFDDGQ